MTSSSITHPTTLHTAEQDALFPAVPLPNEAPTPWIPLDALHELWAHFGREATTPAATEATSTAFAALAAECKALSATNWIKQQAHTRQTSGPSSSDSITLLICSLKQRCPGEW